MPEDWPIFGKVGYRFLNLLNGIFVEGADSGLSDRTGEPTYRIEVKYQDMVYEKKRLVNVGFHVRGDINAPANVKRNLPEERTPRISTLTASGMP